jgi:hypothetical protein
MKRVEVLIRGQGHVIKDARWLCVKCGRDFKLPKVPGTCETLFSICMTCFAISCVEVPFEEDEKKP